VDTACVRIFVGMFLIVNPIGLTPIFMSLTSGQTEKEKRGVARISVVTASIILVAGALVGEHILNFFGISMASFRVAGGILLLLIALSMLHAKQSHTQHTPEEAEEAEDKDSVAVTPLAIPLLAGPGSLSTAILFSHQSPDMFHKGFLIGTIVFIGIVLYVSFAFSDFISARLGKTGINVLTRLFGIILAALGVEFMAKGLATLLPGLAG